MFGTDHIIDIMDSAFADSLTCGDTGLDIKAMLPTGVSCQKSPVSSTFTPPHGRTWGFSSGPLGKQRQRSSLLVNRDAAISESCITSAPAASISSIKIYLSRLIFVKVLVKSVTFVALLICFPRRSLNDKVKKLHRVNPPMLSAIVFILVRKTN